MTVDFDDFVAARSTALLRTAYLLTGDRGRAEDLLPRRLRVGLLQDGLMERLLPTAAGALDAAR